MTPEERADRVFDALSDSRGCETSVLHTEIAEAIREAETAARNAALEEAKQKLEAFKFEMQAGASRGQNSFSRGEVAAATQAFVIVRALIDTPAPAEPVDWAERLARDVVALLAINTPYGGGLTRRRAKETLNAYREARND